MRYRTLWWLYVVCSLQVVSKLETERIALRWDRQRLHAEHMFLVCDTSHAIRSYISCVCVYPFYFFEYKHNRAVDSHDCFRSHVVAALYWAYWATWRIKQKQVKMNMWCFLGTLLLSSQLSHADPANNMVIGYNCTGFTMASQIFANVESIEATKDTKVPWYMKWFSSAGNTVLDVVKTYPPVNIPIFTPTTESSF